MVPTYFPRIYRSSDPIRRTQTAANNLNKNAAPGPDGIINDNLQSFVRYQPDLLLKVFNKCLTEGHFPEIWKKARLVILRKGDKPLSEPSSYRPLCILDCSGKLFEKIIDNRLRAFLEENKCLDSRQFGFRKGRSTTDAVHTLRGIVEANNPKKKIGILTLDIKNAFNSAPWAAILEAMLDKNIPMYLRRIVGSYLESRTLLVTNEGETKTEKLSIGVPQGSVWGPTLRTILYDGLLKNRLPIGVSFLAFADDVTLVVVAENTIILGNLLTSAAEITRKWLANTGLKLAAHKSE